MKKIKLSLIAMLFAVAAIAQPVHDMAVIPVGVTLNQILRLSIINGGNMEFVFSNLQTYETGIDGASDVQYQTRFQVSSSTNWNLQMGAEDATLIGELGGLLALDNVGYSFDDTDGVHKFGTEMTTTNDDDTDPEALTAWGGVATEITTAAAPGGNAGDGDDNDITITWACGTGASHGNLNSDPLNEQSKVPDRYATNVILTIEAVTVVGP